MPFRLTLVVEHLVKCTIRWAMESNPPLQAKALIVGFDPIALLVEHFTSVPSSLVVHRLSFAVFLNEYGF